MIVLIELAAPRRLFFGKQLWLDLNPKWISEIVCEQGSGAYFFALKTNSPALWTLITFRTLRNISGPACSKFEMLSRWREFNEFDRTK